MKAYKVLGALAIFCFIVYSNQCFSMQNDQHTDAPSVTKHEKLFQNLIITGPDKIKGLIQDFNSKLKKYVKEECSYHELSQQYKKCKDKVEKYIMRNQQITLEEETALLQIFDQYLLKKLVITPMALRFEQACSKIIKEYKKAKVKKQQQIHELLTEYENEAFFHIEQHELIDISDKEEFRLLLKKKLETIAETKIKALSPTLSPSPNTPCSP